MSRKGNCWDNAGAESFFHTLKTECVYLETFDTREQAQDVIFEYIGFTIVSVVIRSMATWPQWSMRRPKKQLNCLSGKVLTDHHRAQHQRHILRPRLFAQHLAQHQLPASYAMIEHLDVIPQIQLPAEVPRLPLATPTQAPVSSGPSRASKPSPSPLP